jgi:hypothetical protein
VRSNESERNPSRQRAIPGMDQIVKIARPSVPLAEPSAARPTSASDDKGAFRSVFEGLGRELDRGHRLTERAIHGSAGMASEQLLALQVGVYRYTEVVDLTSKLVDRTCNGLKTTLQAQ